MGAGNVPVILAAFANDRTDKKGYLSSLPKEQKLIRKALKNAESQQICELIERPNATIDEILDVFQECRGRVVLFHFAGHAGSAELLFESLDGTAAIANAGGFAAFLSQQRGLELVFLNGCSSEGQVQGLLDAGVASVIATSQDIDDSVATEFSSRFYSGMASGGTIRASFEEAAAGIRVKRPQPKDAYGASRHILPSTASDDRWPWNLHESASSPGRVDKWSLDSAAGGTRAGTVDIPVLLPYMADRSLQQEQLGLVLDTHRSERPRRPLGVVIYGDEREAHQAFVDRLEQITLPKLLGLGDDSKVEMKGLDWGEPSGSMELRLRRLRQNLAECFAEGDRDATPESIVRSIGKYRCPVMVASSIYSANWQHGEDKVVQEWLETWKTWPDLPPGQTLVIALTFKLEDGTRKSFWERRKIAKRNRSLCEFVEALKNRDFEGFSVAVLDRLEGVSEHHVQAWLAREAGDFCRSVRGAGLDPVVLEERMGQWISEFFTTSKDLDPSGGIPMRILAKELREQLQRCINEGGA
jgi:hypothetical protein